MSTESNDAPWRDKRDKAPTYLALATRLEKTLVRNRELERRCAELERALELWNKALDEIRPKTSVADVVVFMAAWKATRVLIPEGHFPKHGFGHPAGKQV